MRRHSVSRGHPFNICLIMAAGMMMVILLSANANDFTCANGNGEEMASSQMLVAAVNNSPDSALTEVNGAANQVSFVHIEKEDMTAHNLVQNTTKIATTGTQTNSYTGIEVAMRQNDYRSHYTDMTTRIQGENTTRMQTVGATDTRTINLAMTANHGSGTPRLMAANSDLRCSLVVSAAASRVCHATQPVLSAV